jgi:inositol oxygenase
MVENQSIDYVQKMKDRYTSAPYIKCSIWNMINKLENIVDESDPDNDLPQIVHAYQTAESLKTRYINSDNTIKSISIRSLFTELEWIDIPIQYKALYNTTLDSYYSDINDWSWLPLIGFIHDLGKIMMLDVFGCLPQWSVVGDTFPVGIKLSDNYPFFNKMYWKNNKSINGKGKSIYNYNCGFDNIDFSWGHDEYMASFLERNNTNLPDEAIYIIRYHSFYSWHTPLDYERSYVNFASTLDWKMLPLLKAFQKADLYSKTRTIPPVEEIINTYDNLVNKYFICKDLYW